MSDDLDQTESSAKKLDVTGGSDSGPTNPGGGNPAKPADDPAGSGPQNPGGGNPSKPADDPAGSGPQNPGGGNGTT